MAKKLIADLMVDYLERRNVKYVFGLCGHTVIGMLDALSRSKKVKYISNRHEAVASTAADGYARVTHKASVVLCHLGPGLTNVLTGVANAAFDSIPMVVIAGDVPSYYFGKHPHQEVNMHGDATQYKILEPVVKRAWRVDDPEALGKSWIRLSVWLNRVALDRSSLICPWICSPAKWKTTYGIAPIRTATSL